MSLNTTPRTFVTAEVETAAIFNTEVRDALTGLQAAWTAYTPTLGTWTLGNGTLTGAWDRRGKSVMYRIKFVVGSTTTLVGNPTWTLPTANVATLTASDPWPPVGTASLLDTSAGAHRQWHAGIVSGSTVITALDDNGSGVTPTAPWTWATGDAIWFIGSYEAA